MEPKVHTVIDVHPDEPPEPAPDVVDQIIEVYDEMRRLLKLALQASLLQEFPSREWDVEARACLHAANQVFPPEDPS